MGINMKLLQNSQKYMSHSIMFRYTNNHLLYFVKQVIHKLNLPIFSTSLDCSKFQGNYLLILDVQSHLFFVFIAIIEGMMRVINTIILLCKRKVCLMVGTFLRAPYMKASSCLDDCNRVWRIQNSYQSISLTSHNGT